MKDTEQSFIRLVWCRFGTGRPLAVFRRVASARPPQGKRVGDLKEIELRRTIKRKCTLRVVHSTLITVNLKLSDIRNS